MYMKILQQKVECLYSIEFYSIVVDETTDSSNK